METVEKIPFGLVPLYDIKGIICDYRPEIFFDVGANVGQSITNILQYFPQSRIYSMEPIFETYSVLKEKAVCYPNVACYNIALGSKNEIRDIYFDTEVRSTRISLRTKMDYKPNLKSEKITIKTLDNFCSENQITQISYLKIDTEGNDLEVLKGAKSLLSNSHIDLIECEVGMNKTNNYHANFFDVQKFLESRDYYLFGVYEQCQEWLENKPVLRRSNCVFISAILANKTRRNNSVFNRLDKISDNEIMNIANVIRGE